MVGRFSIGSGNAMVLRKGLDGGENSGSRLTEGGLC